jgi:hypothetical protein
LGVFDLEFDGQLTVDRLPDDFVARIERRVVDGLFTPGQRHRADYHVRTLDGNSITFAAHGFLTTYNIGLNEVTVCRSGRNQLQYHVSYRGWARIVVAHGALLGLVFAACYLLVPALRHDIASHPFGTPLFWGMVGFWSLAWPWILSALHRGPAERALQRILRVTLAEPLGDRRAAPRPGDMRQAS